MRATPSVAQARGEGGGCPGSSPAGSAGSSALRPRVRASHAGGPLGDCRLRSAAGLQGEDRVSEVQRAGWRRGDGDDGDADRGPRSGQRRRAPRAPGGGRRLAGAPPRLQVRDEALCDHGARHPPRPPAALGVGRAVRPAGEYCGRQPVARWPRRYTAALSQVAVALSLYSCVRALRRELLDVTLIELRDRPSFWRRPPAEPSWGAPMPPAAPAEPPYPPSPWSSPSSRAKRHAAATADPQYKPTHELMEDNALPSSFGTTVTPNGNPADKGSWIVSMSKIPVRNAVPPCSAT